MSDFKICLDLEELKVPFLKVFKKGYNVLSFEKLKPDSSQIILTVQDTHSKENVLLKLYNNEIYIQCGNKTLETKLKRTLVDYIASKYTEIGTLKEEFEKLAEETGKQIQEALIKSLYSTRIEEWENMVKADARCRLLAKMGHVQIGNHVEFKMIENRYYRKDREIKIKGVYFADLNPVVGEEFGGERPVVIIGRSKNKCVYYCVPLTDKLKKDSYEVGKFTDVTSYLVPVLKVISPQRIKNYIGEVDNDTLGEIRRRLQDEIVYEDEEHTEATEFESSISYDKLQKFKNTLSNMLDMFPVEKISEKEMLDILSQHIASVESNGKIRFERETKNGEKQLKHRVVYRVNGDATIMLNPNSHNIRGGFYPRNYAFSLFSVKRNDPMKSEKYFYDAELSARYRRYMIEQSDYYFLHLIRFLCSYFKNGYDYSIDNNKFSTEEDRQAFIDNAINELKTQFEDVGIFYEGDFEKLVTKGFAAFDINKLKPVEGASYFDRDDEIE